MKQALAEVLARSDIWRGDRFAETPLPVLASGFAELDAELPGGGWPRGALSEVLLENAGIGELELMMPALRAVCAQEGWLLLVGTPHPLHAPAWRAAGLDLARLAIVDVASERDALWAMEQALASGAPGAVLGWSQKADARAVRRLQVAAAAGGTAAFLFRPFDTARQASSAPLRIALAAEADGLALSILKRRGPPLAAPLHLRLPRPVRHGSSLAGARPAPAAARRPSQPVRA
ncbi:MAG TPA: translesion DNA synthesis-associated protein ImuA [Rhodocyclaceae bacterium]